MATQTLLYRASQTLAAFGLVCALAAPMPALAQYAVSDPQLTAAITKAIQSNTTLGSTGIYATASQGVVTLTGNVPTEEDRTEAEQVAGGVDGVRSIQDNITVTGSSESNGAAASATPAQPANASVAEGQSAPPPPPDEDDQAAAPPAGTPAEPEQANTMPPPPPAQPGTAASGMPPAPPADSSARAQYPAEQQGYPGEQQGYAPQNGQGEQAGGWGPRGNAHVPSQPAALGVTPQRQNASGPVSIPAGSLISVRTTQPLSTGSLKAGNYFQMTAAADIYQNGVVAIPRGAIFTGVVVEAKNAGAFGGRPKLDLRLTSLQLGASTYPLQSQVWSSEGASKTSYTAQNTAGGAIFGALIGAIAGGGVGAGVGAIAGGAGGAAISGATRGPRLDLPPEALLQFHLAQPLTVQPVRFEEAQRLVNSVPPVPRLVRRPVYAAPYPPPYPYYGAPYPY